MEKCEYKRKLHERLHKLIDEPMTLGHIEEAGVIAGLLCDLDMLAGRKHEEPEYYALSEDEARAFLMDKDAGGPQRKIAAYYHCIAAKK